MREDINAFIVALFSFLVVFLLDYYNIIYHIAPKAISLLIIIILLLLNGVYFSLIHIEWLSRGKWLLLMLSSLLVQMLVISTGGLFGPFVVLIPLFILGVGFLFSFEVAIFFFISSLGVLIFHIFHDSITRKIFLEDIGTDILYGLSFLSILPLTQVLTQKYHLRDRLFKSLSHQAKVEHAFLESIKELIFIADRDLMILSVNEAVEHTLHKSRSELLHHPLLDIIFLKDQHGLITVESLDLKKLTSEQKTKVLDDVLLIVPTIISRKVTIQIRSITDLEGNLDQFSFIISESISPFNNDKKQEDLEVARARYEARIEDIMKRLYGKGQGEDASRLLFAVKAGQDIHNLRLIEDFGIQEKRVLVDVAKVCQKVLAAQEDFAKALGVGLKFEIINFGEKDIKRLTAGNKNISAEQVTGPFFTALCDVKYVSLIIEKLLDIGILLNSRSSGRKQVALTIEREGTDLLKIKVLTENRAMKEADPNHIFEMYYPHLSAYTNIHLGSGLEGHLAKTVATHLNIPLTVHFDDESMIITFTFKIPKESEEVGKRITSSGQ